MNVRRITKEYEKFKENTIISITTYFNMNGHITCSLNKDIENININRFSISYGDVFILKCSIHYPPSYPLESPLWILDECIIKDDVSSIDLKEYYNYIVLKHNLQYSRIWSPIIYLEIDILEFIQKINHFEYIFENVFVADNKIKKIFKNNIIEEIMIVVWHPDRFDIWKNYDSEII